VFLEYTNQYYDVHKDGLKSTYSDYLKFRDNFEITENMLSDFQALASSKGIEFNYEQWEKDKDFIQTTIKSILARDIWGNNGSMAVFLTTDKQFERAMQLFPEAEKLAHLK
jgi:carboxyl-terminal processing protease